MSWRLNVDRDCGRTVNTEGTQRQYTIKLVDLSRDSSSAVRMIQEAFPGAVIGNISKVYLKSLRPLRLFSEVMSIRCHHFIIAVEDFNTIQDEMLFTLMGMLTRSKTFSFFERKTGSIKTISGPSFICSVLPTFIVKLASSMIFLIFFTVVALVLGIIVKRRQGVMQSWKDDGLRALDLKRVAYLKTDLALNIRAGGSIAHIRGVINGFHKCARDLVILSNEMADWLKYDDIPVVHIKQSRCFNFFRETERMFSGLMFAINSCRVMERFKPNILYQRQCPFDISGLLLSLFFNIPFILECNNSDMKGMYWGKTRFKWLCALVERVLMNGASVVVVISEQLKEVLLELEYPVDKMLVNFNGVNMEDFNTKKQNDMGREIRQRLGIRDNEILVGFVGTFGEWHGIPTLVNVINMVITEEKRIKFMLVGDGNLRKNAEDELTARGCMRSTFLMGVVPFNEVGNYLAACDILISPHSKSPDGKKFFGSPTKLFEYMAAKRAIIASNLDQIGEVLQDGKTAILVEPDNPVAFKNAIYALANSGALRERLAENARKEVSEKYTWQHNVRKVIKFLPTQLGIAPLNRL